MTEQPPTDEPQEPEAPAAEPPKDEPAAPEAEATPEPETAPEPTPDTEPEAESTPGPAPDAEPTPEPAAETTSPPDAEAAPAAEAPPADAEPEAAAPREKPAIPGADLEPDIVPEGQDALGAEGAEGVADAVDADPEAATPIDGEEPAPDEQPIAGATIDLAKGAAYKATGKRKSAVARVVLTPGSGTYTINGRTLDAFFPRITLRRVISQPLETVGYETRMDVTARIHGGGVSSQSGALRHGIARALLEADPNLRGELKRRGFLTRDPRRKERKKAGLKKARKRPQFSKR